MEPSELSGGILSIGTPHDPPSLSFILWGGYGDKRKIWSTVFPTLYPGQETSPAFLGGPGLSAGLVWWPTTNFAPVDPRPREHSMSTFLPCGLNSGLNFAHVMTEGGEII